MRHFPKLEALLLKALISSYDELPKLKAADDAVKGAPLLPGSKRRKSLVAERKKALGGRSYANVLEALHTRGFADTAARSKGQRTLKGRFDVLRDFLALLETEWGPVETWPEPIIDPASNRPPPNAVEDLFRLWGSER